MVCNKEYINMASDEIRNLSLGLHRFFDDSNFEVAIEILLFRNVADHLQKYFSLIIPLNG
jgi:hypothetical protein